MKKYLLSVCCCFALLACDNEETPTVTQPKNELITGFTLIDENGNRLEDIGIPNEKDFAEPGLTATFLPNPVSDYMHVRLTATTPTKITAWLTYAQLDDALQSTSYYIGPADTPGKIAYVILNEREITSDESFLVNVSELPAGPYRLYLKTGNEVTWKNVLIIR